MAAGAPIERLAVPIAAWMHFIRRKALSAERATDPLAEELLTIGSSTSGNLEDVKAFLALEKMFPRYLAGDSRFVVAIERGYSRLRDVTSAALLAQALKKSE